jgi:hypothetical protein
MQFSLAVDPTPILPRIRTRLLARLGPQRDALRLDPVSQLVLAIISSRRETKYRFGSSSVSRAATGPGMRSVVPIPAPSKQSFTR